MQNHKHSTAIYFYDTSRLSRSPPLLLLSSFSSPLYSYRPFKQTRQRRVSTYTDPPFYLVSQCSDRISKLLLDKRLSHTMRGYSGLAWPRRAIPFLHYIYPLLTILYFVLARIVDVFALREFPPAYDGGSSKTWFIFWFMIGVVATYVSPLTSAVSAYLSPSPGYIVHTSTLPCPGVKHCH